jgi:SAM-dependent methyltransferase
MSDNAQQIEFWNGAVGQRWVDYQDSMDRNLSSINDALMKFAAAKPGDRVLDIGCGCGTTTMMLADAVGPSGSVTGVDISKPMLGLAKSRTKAPNVTYIEADASTADLKPGFTLAFSRFGVMFFADPAAAFKNIRESLDAGGRVAFVCWRTLQENAWAAEPIAAARDLLPPQPPVDPHAPGPFAFADGHRLMGILMKAGFATFNGTKLDSAMNMGPLDEAVEVSMRVGPLAAALRDVNDDAIKDKIRERLRTVLAKHATQDGVRPGAACWLVEAKM